MHDAARRAAAAQQVVPLTPPRRWPPLTIVDPPNPGDVERSADPDRVEREAREQEQAKAAANEQAAREQERAQAKADRVRPAARKRVDRGAESARRVSELWPVVAEDLKRPNSKKAKDAVIAAEISERLKADGFKISAGTVVRYKPKPT